MRLTLAPTPLVVVNAYAVCPAGAETGVVVLPDVRGLHPWYESFVDRLAAEGVAAIAIDHFARTADSDDRGGDFDYMEHVPHTTFAGQSEDLAAAIEYLRSSLRGLYRLFVIGFSFGGRMAVAATTLSLQLDGVVAFYARPTGPGRNDVPAPVDLAPSMEQPFLGLFGGADEGIAAGDVAAFAAALAGAGVPHELETYPGVPHSFFDRRAEEFPGEVADAWTRVLEFIGAPSSGSGTSRDIAGATGGIG